mgnify:CR=1 FL=1
MLFRSYVCHVGCHVGRSTSKLSQHSLATWPAGSSATASSIIERHHRRPKPGPGQISGNLEIWDLEIWEFGIQKIQKMKILKIKIRSAQNVGKVWISRKKILLASFGPIWAHFLRGPEKCKKSTIFAYFPWWAPGGIPDI